MEFIISAMLTVNSPLRLINSFVPSNGSTKKKIFSLLKFILFSSEIIGILGNFFFNASQIILFDSRSASVIGELSIFFYIKGRIINF